MDSFLPKFEPQTINPGSRDQLIRCLIRDKPVKSTPEESVRQRVLNWLIETKDWPEHLIRLEVSHPIVGDPTRQRVRSDIELLNEDFSVDVVVECKSADVLLGEEVDAQAREYALKSNAKWIWLTNGDQNLFLGRRKGRMGSIWQFVTTIPSIGERARPRNLDRKLPSNSRDMREVNRYLRNFPSGKRNITIPFQNLSKKWRRFVVDFHSLIFDQAKYDIDLPFSYEGVHILEYRGRKFREFSNQGGGRWFGLYADFLVATQGRVETLSVSIFPWGGITESPDEVRLCVGVTNERRNHHALQMNLSKNCYWSEDYGCWVIYSDGRMASISNETVLEAVREAGLAHLLGDVEYDDGSIGTSICLGVLYPVESASWENNKNFLATLLHYVIVRTNLREAHSQRRRRKKAGRKR